MQINIVRMNRGRIISFLVSCSVAAVAFTCATLIAYSQSPGDPIIPNRGFQPTGSYALGNIETINTTGGNLMLDIPLASLPAGRGGNPGFQLALRYNSKIWDGEPDLVDDPNNHNQTINVVWLTSSDQGGWDYNLKPYSAWVYNRNTNGVVYPAPDCRHFNIWKMNVTFPDGGTREFRPYGHDDQCDDNYFRVYPAAGMSYYSIDGTYARLDITQTGWILSFGDGRRVVNESGPQRTYDRNGNYTETSYVENYNNTGHNAWVVTDQLGRSIAVEIGTNEDYIHATGANGEPLTTTVKWGATYVKKEYRAGNHFQYTVNINNWGVRGVKEIILPAQLGSNLKYLFGYNGWPTSGNTTPSVGWGELNSVTLPSGATASYQYKMDNESGPGEQANWILKNSPTRKDLNYSLEYDGTVVPAPTETWLYGISDTFSSIIAPDGGITIQSFTDVDTQGGGLVYKTEKPDGSIVERIWQENRPYLPAGVTIHGTVKVNNYVSKEFVSIRDAAGILSRTAIKEYHYDKNGNLLQQLEYDWVPYGSVPRDGFGKPTGAIPTAAIRVTTNTYYSDTPDAAALPTEDLDSYDRKESPKLRNAVASSELGDGGQAFSRTEFYYDNALTTGNLTQQKSWDSSKASYSNPLVPGNSISVSHQYDSYGNRTLSTDARGIQTSFAYGTVGAVTDLYPTTIISAAGTTVQRTSTQVYDFHSGLVKVATDVENNVTNETDYDGLGRPIEIRAATNVAAAKTVTRIEYSAIARTVTTRSDLNVAYDGKLVSTDFYDQLGRVRLTSRLEGPGGAGDESAGIKVQTRYSISGSSRYHLVSNPYRASVATGAGSEKTMGWTRSRSDVSGRVLEVQTFGGAALPAPWGTNASSTGTVATEYDAIFTTVTDQAGKARRTKTNALGQLIRVDEPDDNGNLGSNDSPNQATSYSYDAGSNLTTVIQGVQPRNFSYDSLNRLTSSTNPESGTVNYQYDSNGNLLVKSDARVSTHYEYDAMNRVKRRWYNSSPLTTAIFHNLPNLPEEVAVSDEAKYFYDGQSLPDGAPSIDRGYARGRLVGVTYGGGSAGNYYEFDVMGRPSRTVQRTGTTNYELRASYTLAGSIVLLTYPSGNEATYNYDEAGRLNSFAGNLGGAPRTYATGIAYASNGGWTREQFGTTTALFNKRQYNNRQQLYDMRVSTVDDDGSGDRGAIVNYYSQANLVAGGTGPDTNGNLYKQRHWTADDQISSSTFHQQNYSYDSLNRISMVTEHLNGTPTPTGSQTFSYDRYGNRTTFSGSGTGINNRQFAVNSLNNQLGVPGGQTGTMTYDAVGNLIFDSYSNSGGGARKYDGENRMQEAWGNNQSQTYTYDGDGRRVKRKVNGTETWQVYGLDGELLAEYAQNGAAANPQKEYGYRNGELLITATVTAGSGSGPAPTFTNNPLQAGVTPVQSIHFSELRDAINGIRTSRGLPAAGWSESVGVGSPIKASHLLEMRARLDEALGAPSSGYHAGLGIGFPIKAIHVQELRDRVLAEWSNVPSGIDIRWLVTDHLGTPRMIFDQTGSLPNVKRYDYLPFGEELFAGTGGRSAAHGYSTDTVRQKFMSKERDAETGLDYFLARYHSSIQGRFASPDIYGGRGSNPQTLNLYVFVLNNPLKYIDPTGHFAQQPNQDPNRPNPNQPCSELRPCDPDVNDVIVTNTDQKKHKPVSVWNLPSPFNYPAVLCPTGNCGGRTIGDDANSLMPLVHAVQGLQTTIRQNTDSVNVDASVFWVIEGGTTLTADGDIFFNFTPPQSSLVETVVAGASKAIVNPIPFSFSVTTTHIFYAGQEDSLFTRRNFFSGASFAVGGAIPISRVPLGPYVGGIYSPTTGLYGVKTGVGRAPQVNAGFSMAPSQPVLTFSGIAWKKER